MQTLRTAAPFCAIFGSVITGAVRGARAMAIAVTAGVWLVGQVVVAVIDHRFTQLGRGDLHQLSGVGGVFAFADTSTCAVGVLLLLRRPEHPVAWCLAGLGTAVAATGGFQSYGLLGQVANRNGSYPGSAVAALLASSLFVFFLVPIGLVCFLTPNGRNLSPRWRVCAWVMSLSGLLWFVLILVGTTPLQAPFKDVPNPWGQGALARVVDPLRVLTGAVNNVLVLASFVCLALRFRRSHGEERRQLLWLGLAGVPVPVLLIAAFVASRLGNDVVLDLTAGGFIGVFPIAIGLAVAKTRLYDVDRILSRAAAYVLLSGLLAATYSTAVVLLTSGFWGTSGSSSIVVALATLTTAALSRPAYRAIQDGLDRRFTRRRYDALRRVREHVADPPADVSIEQALREALEAPELRVNYWVPERSAWVQGDGSPPHGGPVFSTVQRGGRTVAQVLLDPDDGPLVLAALAEAAAELENTGLRAAVRLQLVEVRASRTRLATAQLEERKRIERDLHDGAQQRLLGLAAQLQAALLNGETSRLRLALEQGVRESRAAVAELRGLANGLHPLVLSEGGLSAALDELASRHPIEVVVHEASRRYPARVEATAWFITCEAVSNALKHASASLIEVEVAAPDSNLHGWSVGRGVGQGSGWSVGWSV